MVFLHNCHFGLKQANVTELLVFFFNQKFSSVFFWGGGGVFDSLLTRLLCIVARTRKVRSRGRQKSKVFWSIFLLRSIQRSLSDQRSSHVKFGEKSGFLRKCDIISETIFTLKSKTEAQKNKRCKIERFGWRVGIFGPNNSKTFFGNYQELLELL